jgi:ABC-2 type transport system ATP-binding protein
VILVEDLQKRFGAAHVLKGISFEVGRGEVVGFLGPNGAGKTTTMRILAGYLPPTSGRALVDGVDVREGSLEARRRLGYLPETVPLYVELRVEEYLEFRAQLRQLSRGNRRAAIDRVVEQCGLSEVRRRLIGTLSRGYRQRVGLADALLASPPILILDEPTVGLDPAQAREIRGLITALGREHTVLLSTHMLTEVEAICARAILLVRGRIVESGALAELSDVGALVVVVRQDGDHVGRLLESCRGVTRVERMPSAPEPAWRVHTTPTATAPDLDGDVREEIVRRLVSAGCPPVELRKERRSLEQVFLDALARGEAAS